MRCHIHLYGKYNDPVFQRERVAVEFLAQDNQLIEATIQGFFETQYEQHLRHVVSQYGGSFEQSKPSAPLIFAETDDTVLYFSSEKRFFDWVLRRFRYEDNTRVIFYRQIGKTALQNIKDRSGRSYCALGIAIGREEVQTIQLELFDEECPVLARNFLDLLLDPKFEAHPVHRVKAGSWLQAGDLVDGSGLHSEAAGGGLLRHESFTFPHDRGGLLGMASHGKDTNGSQFYITARQLPFLDGKFCVFGRVIGGMRAVLRACRVKTQNERPRIDIKFYALPEYTQAAETQHKAKEAA